METEKKNSTDLIDINKDILSYFEKDTDFILAYKKTEKLAGAVYMITNLFSDSEPMKWALRRKVSDLLSFIINYKNISEINQIDFIYNVKTQVLEITSLFEISLNAGLVSVMNFSILKQEFLNLINILNGSKSVLKNPLSDGALKTYFSSGDIESNLREENNKIQNTVGLLSTIQRMSLNNLKDKDHNPEQNDIKRSNRQNTIINLLKKKKEVTIKDIAQVIKDCSEKTIQRELNTFISNGILKRAGVRRWSKYSLA